MAAKKKQAGIEWVGGVVSVPAYVTGEGEPFRPDTLVWVGAEGAVLGQIAGRPETLIDLASASLRSTIKNPMVGRPHTPNRIRVSSPELAAELREGHPGLEIVCAPTPEIDAIATGMKEHMARYGGPASYLSSNISPEAMAAFFRATAALYRAKPWKIVPADQSVFSVSIEQLGVTDAFISVVGQTGDIRGFIFFYGIDDFNAFVEAVEAAENDEEPMLPSHIALSFERGAELIPPLRKEIAAHQWEVAGADAYPLLIVVEDSRPRPPKAEEVTIVEAIAIALSKLVKEKKALFAAWNGGAPFERTYVVQTQVGKIDVLIRIPDEEEFGEDESSDNVFWELFELAEDGGELDHERRTQLEDELMNQFLASPEAKKLVDVQSCHFVMDFAANYFSATIATLRPQELRKILFELIPQKVSIDASAASSIIEENRALYAFLKREFDFSEADACLRVLGGDAVKKLEAALSDSSKFGMAKSIVMGGSDAGFDMSTKEGIEAWMRVAQSQPLPPSVHLPFLGAPPPRPQDKATVRAKKNARKAARKARKKNR
jgi:hypothetical protein